MNQQRLLRLAFHYRKENEFIVCGEERWSKQKFLKRLEALAAGLHRLGVGRGEHIITILPACLDAAVALFLPHVLATVNVPLNPLLREQELAYILRDCKPSVIITQRTWYGQRFPEMLRRLLHALPTLKHVIVIDAEDVAVIDTIPFTPLRDILVHDPAFNWAKISGGDITRITYTSGTTGHPKGVVHTRERAWGLSLRENLRMLRSRAMQTVLLPFPLHHFAGMFSLYLALLAGGRVILMDRFNPHHMLTLIERERVTQLIGSPTMLRMMLRVPGQADFDLTSLQRITFSTESCPSALAEALHERCHCHLQNIYSTSESNIISWTDADDPWQLAATTVGKPAPGVQVQICTEDGDIAPAGTEGEIVVQTRQMMIGYYGDPEGTALVLNEAGWFSTGDIGLIDKAGYLHLVGRQKDIIIRGGENISTVEIENVLTQHPAVRQAAVLGIPDALAGEAVVAFVALFPGATCTVAALHDHCVALLAPYKLPQKYTFIEHMPTTATGKIQKYHLKTMAREAEPLDG